MESLPQQWVGGGTIDLQIYNILLGYFKKINTCLFKVPDGLLSRAGANCTVERQYTKLYNRTTVLKIVQ